MNPRSVLAALVFSVTVAVGVVIGNEPVEAIQQSEVVTLSPGNHVSLVGPVNDESVSQVMQAFALRLAKRGDAAYPLYLVLDTPGGSVEAGYRLWEFLRAYEGIHTITIGSYSMGAILVELIAGERLMLETGTIMFHRMKMGIRPGTTDEALGQILHGRSIEELAESKIAERSGLSREFLHDKIDHEWFLGAHEAIKYNLVDRVVVVRCTKDLLRATISRPMEVLPFMPPTPTTSPACPLLF